MFISFLWIVLLANTICSNFSRSPFAMKDAIGSSLTKRVEQTNQWPCSIGGPLHKLLVKNVSQTFLDQHYFAIRGISVWHGCSVAKKQSNKFYALVRSLKRYLYTSRSLEYEALMFQRRSFRLICMDRFKHKDRSIGAMDSSFFQPQEGKLSTL